MVRSGVLCEICESCRGEFNLITIGIRDVVQIGFYRGEELFMCFLDGELLELGPIAYFFGIVVRF